MLLGTLELDTPPHAHGFFRRMAPETVVGIIATHAQPRAAVIFTPLHEAQGLINTS